MTENFKKWMETVSGNKSLQERLMALKEKSPEQQKSAVIALAKANGITLTAEDFASAKSEELSDDELDAVAGGGGGTNPQTGEVYKCGCFTMGGGGEPGSAYCVCPMIGGGTDNIIG